MIIFLDMATQLTTIGLAETFPFPIAVLVGFVVDCHVALGLSFLLPVVIPAMLLAIIHYLPSGVW
jgi:hypothetical protein